MRFHEVGEKSAHNRRFAAELRLAVNAARRDGLGSAAWKRLATYFAENDEELKLLTPPMPKKNERVDAATNVLLLLLSDTDPTGGTTTHTTTTNSRLCSLPGVCQINKSKPALKKPTSKARAKKTK
jgi:hypothetical protein